MIQRPALSHRVLLRIARGVLRGSFIAGWSACLAMTTCLALAQTEDQVGTEAAKGRPLRAKELISIYQGKTWDWGGGAAYFRPERNVFVARNGEGPSGSYGEGSWSVDDKGQFCFSGTWHSVEGTGPSTTCFEHRTDGKNIYARRLPDGAWYILSHLPAQSDDPIRKIQAGDRVSEDYRKINAYLAEHEDNVAADAATGRALTSNELATVFENRTWFWGNGAGYFRPEHRTFIAWSGQGKDGTYADGSWSLDDQGRLCFTIAWHSITGMAKPSTTCFEHRRDDKRIYARKLPDGSWYVFSHLPAQPEDAIQKLQAGDQVSENYRNNEVFLAEHSRKKRKDRDARPNPPER